MTGDDGGERARAETSEHRVVTGPTRLKWGTFWWTTCCSRVCSRASEATEALGEGLMGRAKMPLDFGEKILADLCG